MSTGKVMDLLATWSVTPGSASLMGVSESAFCQSASKLRSSKAGRVSDAYTGGDGPPWHGTEDEPTWWLSNFQWLGCWQAGYLMGG